MPHANIEDQIMLLRRSVLVCKPLLKMIIYVKIEVCEVFATK